MPTKPLLVSDTFQSLTQEPALPQLRRLPAEQLDAVVREWLARAGVESLAAPDRRTQGTTYRGVVKAAGIPLAVTVRTFQRVNRLQLHHVESFLGHLVRTGCPVGILVTTGAYSRDARRAAATLRSPAIRLISGEQWLQEMASQKHRAFKRRSLWRWVLDLSRQPVRRSA